MGATRFAQPLETCSGCLVTTNRSDFAENVKGQRADDLRTEPANSYPPGLATTMRMAARPSSCLQRKPAAPFDLSTSISIRGQRLASEPLLHGGRTARSFSWLSESEAHGAPKLLSPADVAVIEVDSFGFTYPGAGRPAFRDVAFRVEPGEVFGFLGPSGAGKKRGASPGVGVRPRTVGSSKLLGSIIPLERLSSSSQQPSIKQPRNNDERNSCNDGSFTLPVARSSKGPDRKLRRGDGHAHVRCSRYRDRGPTWPSL